MEKLANFKATVIVGTKTIEVSVYQSEDGYCAQVRSASRGFLVRYEGPYTSPYAALAWGLNYTGQEAIEMASYSVTP